MVNIEVVEKMFPSGKLASNAMVAGDPKNPALMLIHGAGPGAHAAANWTRCVPELAKDFFVIAPDMIGFGKSEIPKTLPTHVAGWMGLRVQQMLGLLDHFGIQKTHIFGNSMGGALAMQLLIEAPERFDKVALMGSIGAPVVTRSYEMLRLFSFYHDPRLPRFRELMRSFVYDPDNYPGLEEIIQSRFKVAMDPEYLKVQENMVTSLIAGMDSLVIPPSVLSKLPHEVVMFHGRDDRIVPLETSLYFMKHLQHAELHILDRCGHWAQNERWDAVGPTLRRHMEI